MDVVPPPPATTCTAPSSSTPAPLSTTTTTTTAPMTATATTTVLASRSASPPTPLPSPGPTSPREGTGNRFGLNLSGFIPRRPRALTRGGDKGGGGGGTATSPRSPHGDDDHPPAADERASYFPSLRRRQNASVLVEPATTTTTATTTAARTASTSQTPARRLAAPVDRPGTASSGENDNGNNVTATTPRPSSATEVGGLVVGTPTTAVPQRVGEYPIRLVPHLDASRSLHFDAMERRITSAIVLKIGRFTDRGTNAPPGGHPNDPRIAFKSKVVSRGHADISVSDAGDWFIKDTKSSSGTFLNHIRLSGPGSESRPFPLRDGDVLQLGVDYQGGQEDVYRCVKMRVELNRDWQRGANQFNQNALAQLRVLGNMDAGPATAVDAAKRPKPVLSPSSTSVTDCCICLFSVTVCQALFIAPCSHVYHYKCIRPLLQMHYPGFSCPLCRTFADLEADVETDEPMYAVDEAEDDGVANETTNQAIPESATDDSLAAILLTDAITGLDDNPPPTATMMTLQPSVTPTSSPSSQHVVVASDSRPASIMVSGPEGVGVAFQVTPSSRPSRPGSISSSSPQDASGSRRRPHSVEDSSTDEDEPNIVDVPMSAITVVHSSPIEDEGVATSANVVEVPSSTTEDNSVVTTRSKDESEGSISLNGQVSSQSTMSNGV